MAKQTSFYSRAELKSLGLKKYGKNVFISRKASFYDVQNISLGDNVRIDDFCILSGHITIGSYVTISAYCALYAKMGIKIRDFVGLAPKVVILSATDDFSGNFLIGSMVPKKFINVKGGKVILNKYVVVGTGSIILPKVNLGEGAGIGAMSLVKSDVKEWTICAGIPAHYIKKRAKGLLCKKEIFLKEIKNG